MNDFKIGDKVRLKKLSEKEFEEIYKNYNDGNYCEYSDYLISYEKFFNKTLEIYKIYNYKVFCKSKNYFEYFYKEELKEINYLKTKFKIVNKILNKNK